jgi:hypothetical protein
LLAGIDLVTARSMRWSRSFVVQDLKIRAHDMMIMALLPAGINGYFGPELCVLVQYTKDR